MAEHEDELRAWAKGLLPLEAATELLIRTGWAGPERRWVHRADDGRVYVIFSEIPDMIGGYSGRAAAADDRRVPRRRPGRAGEDQP